MKGAVFAFVGLLLMVLGMWTARQEQLALRKARVPGTSSISSDEKREPSAGTGSADDCKDTSDRVGGRVLPD